MADPTRVLFESVVRLLAPVLDELVFVGGCLSERLRALGLAEDTTHGAPLCRWRRHDLIVDVMPVDERVLGFGNRWYPSAIETAQRLDIAGHHVRVVTPARALLDNRDFTEALAGFLFPDPASQARRSLVEDRLRSLSIR